MGRSTALPLLGLAIPANEFAEALVTAWCSHEYSSDGAVRWRCRAVESSAPSHARLGHPVSLLGGTSRCASSTLCKRPRPRREDAGWPPSALCGSPSRGRQVVALARSFEFLPRALDEPGGPVRRPSCPQYAWRAHQRKVIRELIQYLRANRCALVNDGTAAMPDCLVQPPSSRARSTRSCQTA